MGATEDLLLLTFVMFILTFVIGLIPLKIPIKPYYMTLIATLAAGLLMGIAFMVILPEGIEMLTHGLEHDEEEEHHDEEEDHESHDDDHEDESHDDHDEHEEHEDEEINGPLMGLAIIAGIIFMMIIHRFGPGHSHGHSHENSKKTGGRTTKDVESGVELVSAEGAGDNIESESVVAPKNQQKLPAVSLGLAIHAMFDGVALGIVTSAGEDPHLSMVVFGALMGHKVPEALSLSIILLAQGTAFCLIVLNLLLLALAAPVGALLTFFILEAGTESSDNAGEALGYCMLFAGGTFIGVIFEHILPELKSLEINRFTWIQLLTFVIGALIPLAIPVDHEH